MMILMIQDVTKKYHNCHRCVHMWHVLMEQKRRLFMYWWSRHYRKISYNSRQKYKYQNPTLFQHFRQTTRLAEATTQIQTILSTITSGPTVAASMRMATITKTTQSQIRWGISGATNSGNKNELYRLVLRQVEH